MIYVMVSMTRLSGVLYKLKRTGPSTDPCGTPSGIYLRQEREKDMLIIKYRFDKYELNHRRLCQKSQNVCKHCKRTSWSIVSNAAERSSKTSAANFPLSMLHITSLCTLRRAD